MGGVGRHGKPGRLRHPAGRTLPLLQKVGGFQPGNNEWDGPERKGRPVAVFSAGTPAPPRSGTGGKTGKIGKVCHASVPMIPMTPK